MESASETDESEEEAKPPPAKKPAAPKVSPTKDKPAAKASVHWLYLTDVTLKSKLKMEVVSLVCYTLQNAAGTNACFQFDKFICWNQFSLPQGKKTNEKTSPAKAKKQGNIMSFFKKK